MTRDDARMLLPGSGDIAEIVRQATGNEITIDEGMSILEKIVDFVADEEDDGSMRPSLGGLLPEDQDQN